MHRIGHKELEIKLRPGYREDAIENMVRKKFRINKFHYEIERKSLDARDKKDIHWLLKLSVFSKELKAVPMENRLELKPEYRKRDAKVVVAGSGPAGFFAAWVLALSGFRVTVLERGSEVEERRAEIERFESTGEFSTFSNYAYGEGGAGTFSDGKLTSRTKTISLEKKFIFKTYVENGAPEEILYLAKPHIGSDNLRVVVRNLRKKLEGLGAAIRFRERLTAINIEGDRAKSVTTDKGEYECDYLVLAVGHSAYDTYRLMMKAGIRFTNKPFAVGFRVEHPQEIINLSQWGQPFLKGVKAADYKLAWKENNFLPVYSFCMCPGGKIVPATPAAGYNIVNGVSDYSRDGFWANSGIVAGFDIPSHLKRDATPAEALDWMEKLEAGAYKPGQGYDAPYNTIGDFLRKMPPSAPVESSYPFGLIASDYMDMLPPAVVNSLREGLAYFVKKMKGFDEGNIIGIETKTSSPVRTERDENGRCSGFGNIYSIGEGSGYAGGIVSSAADGVKTGFRIAGL